MTGRRVTIDITVRVIETVTTVPDDMSDEELRGYAVRGVEAVLAAHLPAAAATIYRTAKDAQDTP